MEALDRESFEFRASFFGRTIEEELVGCLDGSRGSEARAQLEQIAYRRNRRIDEIIAEERARTLESTTDRFSLQQLFPRISKKCNEETPPKQIFTQDECPICQESDITMGAYACGHVVCKDCHECLQQRCGNNIRCPCCRQKVCTLFLCCDL